MSNAYERLISLCENAGIPALPKSVAAAEMRGCSAGGAAPLRYARPRACKCFCAKLR